MASDRDTRAKASQQAAGPRAGCELMMMIPLAGESPQSCLEENEQKRDRLLCRQTARRTAVAYAEEKVQRIRSNDEQQYVRTHADGEGKAVRESESEERRGDEESDACKQRKLRTLGKGGAEEPIAGSGKAVWKHGRGDIECERPGKELQARNANTLSVEGTVQDSCSRQLCASKDGKEAFRVRWGCNEATRQNVPQAVSRGSVDQWHHATAGCAGSSVAAEAHSLGISWEGLRLRGGGDGERGEVERTEEGGWETARGVAETVLVDTERGQKGTGEGAHVRTARNGREERALRRESEQHARHAAAERKRSDAAAIRGVGVMQGWGCLKVATEKQKTTLWEAAGAGLPAAPPGLLASTSAGAGGAGGMSSTTRATETVTTDTSTGVAVEITGGAIRKKNSMRAANLSGPAPYEKKKRYSTKQLLHLIGCPSNHATTHIQPKQAPSKLRRRYVCGHPHCIRARGRDERHRTFTQRHPGTMAEEGVRYEDRQPKWANSREGPKDIELPKQAGGKRRGKEVQCVGDTKIAFNNPGGLGEAQKSLRWGRRMMELADIVVGAECNKDTAAQTDFTRAVHWDPHIKAQVLHAGYHRKGTGMLMMISEKVNATEVRQRHVRNDKLQLIVVDLTINNVPHRIVGGHAPSASDLRKKREYYEQVAMAMRAIREEDAANPFARRRVKVWGQDRNLTLDDRDQLRPLSRTGKRWAELGEAMNEAAAAVAEGADLVDTFRELHPEAREFTHGSRRLDTIEVSEDLRQPEILPRLVRSEHVDREKIAILLPQTQKGWCKWTPEHKTVVVTLRFREEERVKPKWQYGGTRYPTTVWQAAMNAATTEVDRRVGAQCETEGGRVKLTLRLTSAEERQEGWQGKVKEVLQGYEKEEKKRKGMEVSKLTAQRDRWRKIAEMAPIYREDAVMKAEAKRRVRQYNMKLRAVAVRREMAREHELQQALWYPGSEGNRTLYDMVRTKARGGDLMKMQNAKGEEVTSTEGIRELVDTRL
jgi:exonuclease III